MEKRQVKEFIEDLYLPEYSLKELYENYGDVRIKDSAFGMMLFTYRDETDEEVLIRQVEEQKKQEEKDAQDRMTYLILKAKFENNGSH